MKKCTEYTIGETRIIQEYDPDPDTSYLGKYTNDIKPGVYVRSEHEFYERLPAEMERDTDGRFYRKGEPEYRIYSGEYNGIIPAYGIPHDPKNWAHVPRKTKSEVIKKYGSLKNADYAYALEACRSLEALCRNEWTYIILTVRTSITTNTGLSDYVQNSLSGIDDHWNKESDEYKEEIIKDLIAGNTAELLKMGFTADEIKKSTDNPVYPKEW